VINKISHMLAPETSHENPPLDASSRTLESPGQYSAMPTASMIYRQTSPNRPTTDFIGKTYTDKAKKGETT
jgi:hypothetical protein